MFYDDKKRDAQWARMIQEGDRAAFEALFRNYVERLCAFVEQFVASPEIAEEIVQDLFFKIWHTRADWEVKTNVRAYLYRMARNQALDYLRHEQVVDAWKRDADDEVVSPFQAPDENLRQQELARAIEEAIQQLPERRRLIFILSRRHDMTYKEIAHALGISVKTVETQMSRAFKKLRKLLAHCTSILTLFV